MTPERAGQSAEPFAGPARLIGPPAVPTTLDLGPLIRFWRSTGPGDTPAFGFEHLGLKRRRSPQSATLRAEASAYGIRLVYPDGRAGVEIPLLSVDVAGALREVRLHALDRCGFELWRDGRMILRFYRSAGTARSRPNGSRASDDPLVGMDALGIGD